MSTLTPNRLIPNANTEASRAHYVCLRGTPLTAATSGNHVTPTFRRPSNWMVARLLLILMLSAMPILAISVDVFGLVPQHISAIAVVVTLAVALTIMTIWPHRTDVILGRALVAGMVACAVYDAFRLFAVHILGWMGDFIPVMGSWITGDGDTAGSAMVGYMWRYIGDGGGLGVAFYVVALAIGLDRYGARTIVLSAVGYAVFPVWAGLMATVALAPRGEELMFHLTPATVGITLVGHLVFGFVLGLAFVRMQRDPRAVRWPWTTLLQLFAASELRPKLLGR